MIKLAKVPPRPESVKRNKVKEKALKIRNQVKFWQDIKKENEQPAENTILVSKYINNDSSKRDEEKLEYLGEILKILVEEVKKIKRKYQENDVREN